MNKKIKQFLSICLVLIFTCVMFSCAMNSSVESGDVASGDTGPRYDGIPSTIHDSSDKLDGETGEIDETNPEDPNYQVAAHQLTASALFDHNNYSFFESLLYKGQDDETSGEFALYQEEFNLALNRVSVKIENGANVKVDLLDEFDNVVWKATADQQGICYLFNKVKQEEYKINVHQNNEVVSYIIKDGDTISLSETENYDNVIDLAFIIDTTGSMGDEIRYLKSEIINVIARIKEKNAANVRLALLFYRDVGDEYVTLKFDFETNIDLQVERLSNQFAVGGGDFPEAVQSAFSDALNLKWSNSSQTKIIVHVADAPSHDEDVANWFTSVKQMSEMGIRIINVASSGINKKCEFLFRSQCIQTNGCYAFLTNDSGIGGDHLDATVEEKLVVEYLDDLLVRVISGLHSGIYEDAIPYFNQNQQSEQE